MSEICPTILAANEDEYRAQLARVAFAPRIQIDLMDGDFAPNQNVQLDTLSLPEHTVCDIHLMYRRPQDYIDTLIALAPHMVIVHAESECDIPLFAAELRKHGIKTGVAVLPETTIETISYILPHVQHMLVFSGDLGHFGGVANIALAQKAAEAKAYNRHIEVGWDGGANESNCLELAQAGIDVINVGGAIQKADNPESTYATMKAKVTSV